LQRTSFTVIYIYNYEAKVNFSIDNPTVLFA
jgi:hypothetical protein